MLRTNKQRASILLEALLTISILSISLAVIVQSVTASYRASRMGWRYSEAALALDNAAVERIFRGGVAVGVEENGDLEKPFSHYRYHMASRSVILNGLSNQRLNDVAMNVAWNDGAHAHSIGLQTFLFNTTSSTHNASSE